MITREENERRLGALRESYWAYTPDGDDDLYYGLHDALTYTNVVEEPTRDQAKALFMMLPGDILGTALAWGFSHATVRENLWNFVRDNKRAVLEAVKAAAT